MPINTGGTLKEACSKSAFPVLLNTRDQADKRQERLTTT